jgi:hypothetical protein
VGAGRGKRNNLLMTQLPDALIGYCMILQMGADLT